ncbi:GNAT family N-acetyltransferase [uncultured Tenacibaculum sp.]|uniref:GNAT family N-acetyltransferase n=1 Tax=uncultured Tenacibaculum sp. TaxID=174713 RepID=UPI00262DB228|nr:GNAT family N-acetyltransferase [uncultured Tenacibaculum sp.]
MIEVKKIIAGETSKIRLEVLRKGIDLPYKFKEDLEEDTFHLGVFYREKLVTIATFIRNNLKGLEGEHYQLRGMATLPEVRGKGFGKIIIEAAVKVLKTRGIKYLWCNARKEVTMFYEKLKFVKIGDEFMVEKVGPHFKMYTKV